MLRGTTIDIVIIVVYFFAILAFGTWFGRYVKTTKDFFFGGQRFSWWLIAFSCVATLVGSYSFIKYSAAGYRYGISSTMTYLNDWFIAPLFVLGWLPIIYFSRVTSIPEYFEKRFDRKTRIAGVFVLLVYLTGYIGINLYTIGVAFNSMMGWDIMTTAVVISIICAIYMHAGGQTSVIMTDLAQSVVLLITGVVIFVLGISYIGGLDTFWSSLSPSFKLPFSGFRTPPEFNSVGIFWQDAFGSSIAFYFMNQGVLMRFMSVKSPREGKKAFFMVVLLFMPLAALAVSNAGWLGRSMVNLGIIPASVNPNHIFVEVANRIAVPGVFGFIMAALTAALMSTVDTLINAVSAISVNDVVRNIAPGRDDSYYLKWARITAILAAVVGVVLVPLFMSFKSIYVAHGTFIAAVTPPMIITIILGAFWKRFTTTAAFSTLIAGSIMMVISIAWPSIISPFDHGVALEGYKYIRAFYGFIVCSAIGVGVSLMTAPRSANELSGLVIDSIEDAKRYFKGGAEPNDREPGKKVSGVIQLENIDGLRLSARAMDRLKAGEGDILYISDARWWLGGIFSARLHALKPHDLDDSLVLISRENASEGNLRPERPVRVEKIL